MHVRILFPRSLGKTKTQPPHIMAALLAMALTLSSCASGMKRTPEPPTPNLDIPPAQMEAPAHTLPRLVADADKPAILGNHVASAKAYHALRIRFEALVCTLTTSAGITINGSKPVPREGCTKAGREGD